MCNFNWLALLINSDIGMWISDIVSLFSNLDVILLFDGVRKVVWGNVGVYWWSREFFLLKENVLFLKSGGFLMLVVIVLLFEYGGRDPAPF